MIYYIGIDISKYKHDFCIISNTDEIIVENSSFENNKKGFQFLSQLKSKWIKEPIESLLKEDLLMKCLVDLIVHL